MLFNKATALPNKKTQNSNDLRIDVDKTYTQGIKNPFIDWYYHDDICHDIPERL